MTAPDLTSPAPDGLTIRPVTGLPDFRPGDDLAAAIATAAPWLADGDVLIVTSKVLSKVEGRLVPSPTDPEERDAFRRKLIDEQTVRLVAQVGRTRIVENRLGIVAAAAGIDASNVRGDERVALHFQEWWIRYRAGLRPHAITPVGADAARPAPGVLQAIADADLVLIAPSNPVVSIGTVLAVPGIAEAVRGTAAPVVGVAPIIAGAPVRGHADACLAAIGVESTAEGVGRHYGARSAQGLLDGYLIAESDTADIPGVAVRQAPLLMTDPKATAAMVAACVDLARAAGADRPGGTR